MEGVHSKFRYALKTKKVISPGDKVAVITTGSFLSQALLDLLLIHQNLNETRPERGKVHFELEVLWVDGSCLRSSDADCSENLADHESIESVVATLAKQRNSSTVPITRLGLEDVFGSLSVIREERQRALISLIRGLAYESGREDLVKHLKRRAAILYAKANGFNKLALDHSATILAAHIIGSTAKARGFDLPGDLHFVDNRLRNGPTIIRPLKELHSKELGLYCHFCGIPTSSAAEGMETQLSNTTINDAAQKFVLGLQRAFPSGLSSIVRTGSKLQSFSWNDSPQTLEDWMLCGVCLAPIASIEYHDKAVDALDDWWKTHFCFSCCGQLILQFKSPGSQEGDPTSLSTLRMLLSRIHEHSSAVGIHL